MDTTMVGFLETLIDIAMFGLKWKRKAYYGLEYLGKCLVQVTLILNSVCDKRQVGV